MFDLETVREGLSKLDPTNDEHWTAQGLPRMDALAAVGLNIERRLLNELVPGFNRAALLESRPVAPESSGEAQSARAEPELDSATASHRHIVERHTRHRKAVEVASKALAEAGLSMADLTSPTRSRIDLNIAARNRAARRELRN